MKRGFQKDEPPKLLRGAERLRAWMEAKDFRQEDVAKAIGTLQQTISRYLSGTRVPPLAHAAEIERVTGIPMLEWVPPRKKAS